MAWNIRLLRISISTAGTGIRKQFSAYKSEGETKC